MIRQPTEEEKERARWLWIRWSGHCPPCGISYADIYNPCLPEYDEHGKLFCCTCGLRQKLEVANTGQ
jgi:hypothetical protein